MENRFLCEIAWKIEIFRKFAWKNRFFTRSTTPRFKTRLTPLVGWRLWSSNSCPVQQTVLTFFHSSSGRRTISRKCEVRREFFMPWSPEPMCRTVCRSVAQSQSRNEVNAWLERTHASSTTLLPVVSLNSLAFGAWLHGYVGPAAVRMRVAATDEGGGGGWWVGGRTVGRMSTSMLLLLPPLDLHSGSLFMRSFTRDQVVRRAILWNHPLTGRLMQ